MVPADWDLGPSKGHTHSLADYGLAFETFLLAPEPGEGQVWCTGDHCSSLPGKEWWRLPLGHQQVATMTHCHSSSSPGPKVP